MWTQLKKAKRIKIYSTNEGRKPLGDIFPLICRTFIIIKLLTFYRIEANKNFYIVHTQWWQHKRDWMRGKWRNVFFMGEELNAGQEFIKIHNWKGLRVPIMNASFSSSTSLPETNGRQTSLWDFVSANSKFWLSAVPAPAFAKERERKSKEPSSELIKKENIIFMVRRVE